MFALEKMIVILEIIRAGGATVVAAETPFMEAGTHRQKFPTKFMKKCMGVGVFGIHGGEGVPIYRNECLWTPMEMMAVVVLRGGMYRRVNGLIEATSDRDAVDV